MFTHNYERVRSAEAAKLFFVEVYELSRQEGWTSDARFTADGTLVEAWASLKSFVRKDGKDREKVESAKDDDPGNSHRQLPRRETQQRDAPEHDRPGKRAVSEDQWPSE